MINRKIKNHVCVLYVRHSGGGSGEGAQDEQTLETQKTECLKKAAQEDWEILKGNNGEPICYVDEGISGQTERKRPAFLKMLADAAKPDRRFNAVLVRKYDRFSRGKVEALLTRLNQLLKQKVDVLSVYEPFDCSTPEGKLMLTQIASFSEYFISNLGRETRSGMASSFRRGFAITTLPFGMKRVKVQDGDKTRAKPAWDEDKLPIVKYIFEKYASDVSKNKILDSITKDFGVKRAGWRTSNFKNFLTNTAYIGKLKMQPKGMEPLFIDVPAVIDTMIFEMVQERISKQSEKRSTARMLASPAPLNEVAFCQCGRKFVRVFGSKVKDNRGLGCVSKRKSNNFEPCGNSRQIKENKIVEFVKAQVWAIISRPEVLLKEYEQWRKKAAKRENAAGKDIKRLSGIITRTERKLKKTWELYYDGKLDKEQITARINELAGEKRKAETELKEKQAQSEKPPSKIEQILKSPKGEFMRFVASYKRTLVVAKDEELRAMLRDLGVKIVIGQEKIQFSCCPFNVFSQFQVSRKGFKEIPVKTRRINTKNINLAENNDGELFKRYKYDITTSRPFGSASGGYQECRTVVGPTNL